MSFLSKLTVVAAVVLGVRALQSKRTAKLPLEGTPARKPVKASRSPKRIAATSTRSTAPDANGRGVAPKTRSKKRSKRGPNAKPARA
jgi:hypothetical protein